MPDEVCPICCGSATRLAERDYGDKRLFECGRCGRFEITGSAAAMLQNVNDKMRRARLSHNVRRGRIGAQPLLISTTNIEDLSSRPLPDRRRQIYNLVEWLKDECAGDYAATVPIPWLNDLIGVIGVTNTRGVEIVIGDAVSNDYINWNSDDNVMCLTLKGSELIQGPEKNNDQHGDGSKIETEKSPHSNTIIVKANCNECGGQRESRVLGSFEETDDHEGIRTTTKLDVFQCCGCRSFSVRQKLSCSEWDVIEEPNGVVRYPEEIRLWPPVRSRAVPKWTERLEDEVLKRLFDEVYAAIEAQAYTLAAIGSRTLLDWAMSKLVGDPQGGFRAKLEAMKEKGYISQSDFDSLQIVIDAQSASAHRGYTMKLKQLGVILDATEDLLHRLFVSGEDIKKIKQDVPSRDNKKF